MIDDKRLLDLQKIMQDDFSDLIEIFIEDSIQRSINLKHLLKQTPLDIEAIRRDAHTLKGSSGNVFATKLHGLYLSLETLAAEANLTEVSDLISDIEMESKLVFEELKSFNQSLCK